MPDACGRKANSHEKKNIHMQVDWALVGPLPSPHRVVSLRFSSLTKYQN